MNDLHLELSQIWYELDQLPIPAPSHRNRTMTQWAAVIERVKKRLGKAGNISLALQDENVMLQQQLADAQQQLRSAANHAALLSAEIERLRSENRLILDALGMEKYRVLWRPIEQGGEWPPAGTPVLAVVWDGEPAASSLRRVVRAKYVPQFTTPCSRFEYDGDAEYHEESDEYYWPAGWYEWNDDGDSVHYRIGDWVTHWAPLPGLPEVHP